MARIWELFPDVAARVRKTHEKVGLVGHHDCGHAYRVGDVAYEIAADEWNDRYIAMGAGLAGVSHNADHILQKELGCRDVPYDRVWGLVHGWIGASVGGAAYEIIDAVRKHDGINSSEDSKILIALMDADRVVNLDVDLFIRSGQRFPNDPAVDYLNYLSDPEATYRKPKSVLRDIAYALDWVDPASAVCVRTRLGKKMAESRVKVFRTFFDALKVQLEEEGMYPYPFPS